MTQADTPPTAPTGSGLKPHRGVMILVFGILAFVCCFIFGIVAWVMGSNDLNEMEAGIMDPSGQGLTQAGRIVGAIGGLLGLASIVLAFLFGGLGALLGGP